MKKNVYSSKCESLLLLTLYRLSLSKISYIYCCCYPATKSYPTLYDPMNCSTLVLPVHHQLLEFTQTHAHWVGDAIQPSHPLSSPPHALNLSQHQGLFKWVSFSHQVAKVLEFQLQHHSFQRNPRVDLLHNGLVGSLQFKGLSRVFSNITVQKHQFFRAQLSL